MEIEDRLATHHGGIGASEDYERYVKMALRIAPNDPDLIYK